MEIHWGRVGVMLVAGIGIASIFFLIAKEGSENRDGLSSTPVLTLSEPQSKPDDKSQSPAVAADSNTYQNDTYGFGVTFISRAAVSTECPFGLSTKAYNPITEYVFSDKAVECAHDTQDPEDFYSLRGGRLLATVFDLKKCLDKEVDSAEKTFCQEYAATTVTTGQAAEKEWPSGSWTKSGEYLTFYSDLTFEQNKNWQSDYTFLALASLNTYKNVKYGLEFQYPKNWSIDTTRTDARAVIFADTARIEASENREAVNFEENSKNLSLDQFVNNFMKERGYDEEQIVRDYQVKIGGEKTVQIGTGEFGLTLYVFIHQGTIFTVETQGLFSDNILKTFRFVK